FGQAGLRAAAREGLGGRPRAVAAVEVDRAGVAAGAPAVVGVVDLAAVAAAAVVAARGEGVAGAPAAVRCRRTRLAIRPVSPAPESGPTRHGLAGRRLRGRLRCIA